MILRTSIFRFFVVLFSFSFFLIIQSCGGACAGNCGNGECEQGVCVCDEGWEGTTCNTSWSEKFIGSYEGKDCYDSGVVRYTINQTNRPDSIIFDNQFHAIVKDGDNLIFPEQEANTDGVDFIFSGTGNITSSGVDMQLFSKYPTFEIKCELSLERTN
ncbi:MAG: hypothetical protein JXQ87_05865 [Bacteroidia bacterium]